MFSQIAQFRMRQRLVRGATIFVVSATVAAAVFGLTYLFREQFGLAGSADEAVDALIEAQADRKDVQQTSVPIVVLDFDDATFASQNWPLVVPRDMLARAVDVAARSKARLIVVDTDIGWDTAKKDTGLHKAKADDAPLTKALTSVESNGVPSIFVRETFLPGDGSRLRILRFTPYDTQIAQSKFARFASFGIVRERDGVARRIVPWQMFCRNGRAVGLPGAHVLASVALIARDSTHPFQSADERFGIAGPHCGAFTGEAGWLSDAEFRTPAGLQRFSFGPAATRLIYRLSWMLPAGVPRATLSPGPGLAPRPVLQTISASILTRDDRGTIDALKGAIVVIGASAEVARDKHSTPLGPMPGVGVVANAVAHATLPPDAVRAPNFLRWVSSTPPFVVGLIFTVASTALTWLLFFAGRGLTRNHVLLDEGLRLAIEGLWLLLAWRLIGSSVVLDVAVPQIVVTSMLVTLTGLTAERK